MRTHKLNTESNRGPLYSQCRIWFRDKTMLTQLYFFSVVCHLVRTEQIISHSNSFEQKDIKKRNHTVSKHVSTKRIEKINKLLISHIYTVQSKSPSELFNICYFSDKNN